MVFGLKGKKKKASSRRYGGEGKGTYGKGAYSKRVTGGRDRAYYSDDEYSYSGDSYYDGDELGYYYDEEYPEDDLDEMDMRDEREQLVTRDQVLGELRAQAAADALGQSLEQMGYNLDNCDSFYSLSDTEAKDNRYIIQPKDSEVSNGADQKKKPSESRRRRKSKKKKAKASQSRYTVTSDDDDDDDEFTQDYTKTHRRGTREYDTYATSFDSDEDSYFEDGTYITGRDSRFTDPASRFTGKTSRFSRRTGKLTAKNRKPNSRRTGDLDTYYSRGTDWTNGDSRYDTTIGDSSTLSSMSTVSSEMEDTMYTEVTSKSGRLEDTRRSGRKSRRHGKEEKRRREMAAIQEKDSEEDSDVEPKERRKRTEKKPPTNWKRSDSSRLSGSSQIGAMRSVSSSKDPNKTKEEPEVRKEKGNTKEKRKEHRKQSSSRSISSSKKSDRKPKSNDREKKHKPSKSTEELDPLSSDPESLKDDDEDPPEGDRQKRRKSGKHKIADSDEVRTEADTKMIKRKSIGKRENKHESSESEDSENKERTNHSKKTGKNSSGRADNVVPPEIKDAVSDLSEPEIEPETPRTNASKKSKQSSHRRNGRDVAEESEDDENDDNERDRIHKKQSMKSKKSQRDHAPDSEYNIKRKDGHKKAGTSTKKGEEMKQTDASTSERKSPKKQAAETVVSNTDGNTKNEKSRSQAHPEISNMDDEKSTKTSGTKSSRVSHALTLASKKFWPRQFLSQRNKKGQGAEAVPETTLNEGKNDDAPSRSREPKETSVKGNPSKSGTNHVLPSGNTAFDDEEEPNDERDDANTNSGDRSQLSPRSRGRGSQSYNKASRPSRVDGRSKSPSHRSRSHSKGPETSHTKAKTYKQEGGALNEVGHEEGGLPSPNREHATKEEEVGAANQTNSSVGICEVAAMAVLIPLAPFAAMYSCYNADATQAMIGGATEACAQECKDVVACNDTNEAEVKSKSSIDENTRTSSKKNKSKSRKYDDSTVKTNEKSHKSTKTSSDGSRKSKNKKPPALTRIPTLEETVASVVNSPSKLSRFLRSPRSPRSPRSKQQKELPQTRIQEAEEGFESFLPGSFECLPFSDTTTVASHAKSLLSSQKSTLKKPLAIQDGSMQRVQPSTSVELATEKGRIQQVQPPKNKEPAMEKSQATTKPKKGKRWLPKMPKILPKKKKEQEDRVVYVMELAQQPQEQEARKDEKALSRLPSHLPVRQSQKKPTLPQTESMKAVNSYWAETPTAYKARQMVENQDVAGDFREPFSPGGDLAPFVCSAKTKACGNYDGDFDRSILSEEDIPVGVLPGKPPSRNSKNRRNSRSRRNSGGQKNMSASGHDGRNTSHKDFLKDYDLDQTLSDVLDARQTLENAYGQHSGGASFDHTIDEQLVELLAHMAEMDHDDAVEIEAAIKKLKRHARKLGISERDLLFSVKSAEESALEDEHSLQDNVKMPPTFGDKMLDAFEGYFGRK